MVKSDRLTASRHGKIKIDAKEVAEKLSDQDWVNVFSMKHVIRTKGGTGNSYRPVTDSVGTKAGVKVHLKSGDTAHNLVDYEEVVKDYHLGLPSFSQVEVLAGISGGTGGSGETAEYFNYGGTSDSTNIVNDEDWTKQIINEYASDQAFTFLQGNIYSEYAVDHNGEMIATKHPFCTTRELSPFADPSDPGTSIDVTDTFGGNTKKQIHPSSLFTILYDLHYTESCDDPFTPDMGMFSMSSRTADFSDSNTQAVDTPYFSFSPTAYVGVIGIHRRIASRVLLKIDDNTALSTDGLEGIPVALKFTQKNKYGQTCSTHGDQLEVEVTGKHKHIFEAGFAVIRKVHTICTDDGSTDLAEEIKRLQSPDTDGDRLDHTSYGKGHTPSEKTEPEGTDYSILFKSPCIKLSDAKTKDCKGKTIIKVYVTHKHDKASLGSGKLARGAGIKYTGD